MNVTVCELRNDPLGLAADWDALVAHVQEHASDLVLLPEMPFSFWLAANEEVSPAAWLASVREHEAWIQRLPELNAQTVLATRPVVDAGVRFNEGFIWTRAHAVARRAHRKRTLPAEEGFWESSWYAPGDLDFRAVSAGETRIGFAICTEIWFFEHARAYGKQEVDILASPRATLAPSVDKWVAGGRAAAVVSGAYCLSSNLSGPASGAAPWGGTGWIIEPEEGHVLGTTSPTSPFLTLDIDLGVAREAKFTYPRYVAE